MELKAEEAVNCFPFEEEAVASVGEGGLVCGRIPGYWWG